MNTGVQSFTDPSSLGPLYPFVGTEVLLVILGLVFWIGWHVIQTRGESKEYKEASRLYREVGLERAMHDGGSGHIASEEERKIAEVNRSMHEQHERGKREEDQSTSADTGRDEPTSDNR
jgi:hypothetical protein